MFSKFDEDSQKVLLMAKKEMMDLKHPYVGSEHLLLAILHNTDLAITQVLSEYKITYKKYKDEIIKIIGIGKTSNDWFLYTPLLKRIIENAILDCKDDDSIVTVDKLFISLLEEGDGVANRILLGMNIDIDLLYEKFSNRMIYHSGKKGRNLLLEEYAIDLNKKCEEEGFDPVVGRDVKVNRMIEILLRRTKNNPLLLGDAGVGKTAIVEELVRRIIIGSVPKNLENSRIFSISMASLISGTKYRGEFEERINKIISELENEKNIILFIDEIHTLVGAGGAEGAIDASNILKPYLARGKIKIIGATTIAEYKKYLEKDKALDRRFQKIYVEEPTASETEKILFQLRDIYENYHGVKISDEIIKLIVEFSDRYITTGRFPDKAIDILDEACSKTAIIDNTFEKKNRLLTISMNEVRNKKNKAIIDHDYKLARQLKEEQEELETLINKNFMRSTKCKSIKSINKDTLYDVIYEKTKIPVKKILKYNKNSLTLSLNKTVFGQKKAIDEILDITLSRKINKNVPISLLLVGKTGVGKTLLVKEYARLLYPKTAFIRLDMSEYKEGHSISKIIGAPAGYVGYNDNNCILEKVKDNPYSIFLIDEIEKAHPDVLRLFLQVLDTGCMTNSYGELIDFSNVVIFMTSNLGTTNKKIGFSSDNSLVYEKFKEFLGVEFINRIDKVIYFDDIDSNTIGKIISKRAIDLGFEKDFSPELVNKIKNECNYKEFGARHVDKVLRKYVDTFTIKH